MSDIQALIKIANQLPLSLSSLAEALEKGQAMSPLQNEALALADFPGNEQTITLVLLGMSPEARSTILNWLIGPQHQNISVKLSEPLELLEIRLQERGFVLDTDFNGRSEFSNPEDFLAALAKQATSTSVETSLIEPIRLSMAAPPPLCNLTLLTPANVNIIASAPRILSSLAGRTALMVLAAPENYSWTTEELSAINMIAENVLAIWPVLTNSENAQGRMLLNLAQRLALPCLPLSLLPHVHAAPIPNFILSGPQYPLRQAVTLKAYARRCLSLLEMIEERFEMDFRQVESRQKREARLERSLNLSSKEQDGKLLLERLKSQVNEELSRLLQTLRETSRRSQLKTGTLGEVLEHMLHSLQADDLEREIAQKNIKLSLKPDVLSTFRRRLAKTLQQQVNEDCILIRDSLEQLRQSTEQLLAETGATTRSLSLAAPDNCQLWEMLGETLQLEIRYKGELPRRGFWQRMAEGRRIVFIAMMLLSLVGGFAGFNVRQIGAFGFVFLALFIGGIIYTYSSWHKEEAEQLDKEIEKVRENLQTEFSRVLNDILRDKLARLQQLLDELKRDAQMQIDNALKEAQRNQALHSQNELRDAKIKLKVIEQRLKELRPLAQQINGLLQEIKSFEQETKQYLHTLCQAEAA
jgi:hypothetical protein